MAIPTKPCYDYQAATKDKERDYQIPIGIRRRLWDYIRKRYLDQGFTVEKAIDSLVRETSRPGQPNVPRRFFQEVITGPKADRTIKSGQQWRIEDDRRKAQWKAQQAIDRADNSWFPKMVKSLENIPRAALTFFHAGVFPVTHGGELLMHPTQWKTFADGWYSTMRTMPFWPGKRGQLAYENMRDDIYNDPEYGDFRAGGLRVGVDERVQGLLSGWLAEAPGWNQYAWIGLIKMRMNLMKQLMGKEKWNSPEEKLELIKQLAPLVNHATGVVETRAPFGQFLSSKMFSPQLTASKAARGFTDPAKMLSVAIRTMTGGRTTAGERAFARHEFGKVAGYLTTRVALLYLNNELLKLAGSDQTINFGLEKGQAGMSDFLRFKTGTGLIVSDRALDDVLRLYGGAAMAFYSSSPRERHGKGVQDAMLDSAVQWFKYKMDPGYETAAELVTGEDIFGRPIPSYLQAGRLIGMPERVGTAAKPQYGFWEYTLAHAPLFIGGPSADIYEALGDRGLPEAQNNVILNAAVGTFLHGLGMGTRVETQPRAQQPTRQKPYRGPM